MDTDMNKELFVSPDGNDAAEGSVNAPLRTLVGAKSKENRYMTEIRL